MTSPVALRPADPLGVQRSMVPVGVLPQQADRLDPTLPLARDELLIEVESLNIDSASFKQISDSVGGGVERIGARVAEIVRTRGKQHNPVTGSGGMLLGRVAQVGPEFPTAQKPVSVGDRVATLVSLTLTPLAIRRLKHVDPARDRVDIEGHAIVFASGIFARLDGSLPDSVALAILDVAGAPAQTERLLARVPQGGVLAVIGGGGKSGLLCLAQAARTRPDVTRLVVEPGARAAARVRELGLASPDQVLEVDARSALAVRDAVARASGGRGADLVINVANVPETEMGSILAARSRGCVYFFSMATSFSRAALGAEGLGADVDLMIGNGYAEGHAELALSLVRNTPALARYFVSHYGAPHG